MPESGTPEAETTRVGDAQATLDVAQSSDVDTDRYNLLIIGAQLIVTKSLPPEGEVHLGRASESDVVIDDPSVSRRHATLSMDPPLSIRDLGSVNGTQAGHRRLAEGETAEIEPGDVLRLGDVTLIVQRRTAAVRTQRIWAHDYFEARLEEECSRAERRDSRFAVTRLHCRPAAKPRLLHQVLAGCARDSDVVGEYSPSELEILLLDTEPAEAQKAVDRLLSELVRHDIEATAGLACFPSDGRTSHELLHRASPLPRASAGATRSPAEDAVVADRRMQDLYRMAERIAAGSIPVLILGETGVGKEVLAERIHRASPRAENPYLKLNCAALSETLLESELFGHEKGAFTGAAGAKPGLLETANGGSVFLDEIGELPYSLQVKLLRVLEEGSVLRVGGLKPRSLDVRFIAATNRDVEAEVERGTFRQDLFFRLNGATLVIPPLRERTAEIVALAEAFAAQAARQVGAAAPPSISGAARELLLRYGWPGNIRELRNVMDRAVLLCGPDPILPAHLPLEKMQAQATEAPVRTGARSPTIGEAPNTPVDGAVAEVVGSRDDDTQVQIELPKGALSEAEVEERERILEALAACMGNQTAAAKRLGIARRTLIKRLERYGISGPRKKRDAGWRRGESKS